MTSIASPSASPRAIEFGRLVLGLFAAFLVLGGVTAPAQVSDSYRVQPTDVLIIEVANEPKLAAKEFRVSASGEISYPFIGAVRAAERTTVEIQAEVKRLLETDYLVNAQVLVQVRDFRKQIVSVFGQVARPGLIEIPPERKMTAIEAISAAGGLTRLARQSSIQLIREGRKEPTVYSLDELKNPDKPVYVESGDMIFVPESRI
ncbi:MAG: polysaccharide biosynthesis/export family protein [Limisphaerales bacterium]